MVSVPNSYVGTISITAVYSDCHRMVQRMKTAGCWNRYIVKSVKESEIHSHEKVSAVFQKYYMQFIEDINKKLHVDLFTNRTVYLHVEVITWSYSNSRYNSRIVAS